MMKTIADNLKELYSVIPAGTKLVAVSKFRPLEQLRECYDAGCRVFAESRPLEFESKVKAMPEDIEWHFIGHLQTNKLKHVLPYAALVQSVDSERLLAAIQHFCEAASMRVEVLLEVHIGMEDSKDGFTPSEVRKLLSDIRKSGLYPDVTVRGLMGMASNTDDRDRISSDFAVIEALFGEIRESDFCPRGFDQLSIGMSGDFRIAINHGATIVRIGSAVFEN